MSSTERITNSDGPMPMIERARKESAVTSLQLPLFIARTLRTTFPHGFARILTLLMHRGSVPRRHLRWACGIAAAALVPAMMTMHNGAAAQGLSRTNDFRWNGTLPQGETLEVRGVNGSIRAIPSTNGAIQVDARIHDSARLRVDVVPREGGITICSVVSTQNGNESECQPGYRTTGAQGTEGAVDFVIQIPAGVRFSASMIHGDITVENLWSDVNVATINGNIELNLSPGHGAEFYGNTVSGAIDSDFPIYGNAPLPPEDRPVDAHRPQIVRARIGDGGPAFDASTISGNIRLRTMAEPKEVSERKSK
jgi:hypothetical protein